MLIRQLKKCISCDSNLLVSWFKTVGSDECVLCEENKREEAAKNSQ